MITAIDIDGSMPVCYHQTVQLNDNDYDNNRGSLIAAFDGNSHM